MFDWKILAASFAALLVVSSVLVGGFGFGDILGKLKEWLGESPLGGFVTAPVRGSRQAEIVLTGDVLEIPLEGTDFSIGDAEFRGYTGSIRADFPNDRLEFVSGSGSVAFPYRGLTIGDMSLGSLTLEDSDFHVLSEGLDTSAEGATLEVQGFTGSLSVGDSSITLDGNVTLIRGNGKDIV
jgi:hypothetical protein